MVFSSPQFIFAFLPLVFILYCLVKSEKHKKLLLVLSSLIFYGWWEPKYLLIIIASISVNYFLYKHIVYHDDKAKLFTWLGVSFNILLLMYFKYSYFIVDNLSYFVDGISIDKMLLPLGISFFTFQQIAFLIDTYKKNCDDYNFLDYSLFVTFFPQLIAGPIVHHKEMMPQFKSAHKANYNIILKGLIIFAIGLFKKLVIADSFAVWANAGFSNVAELTFLTSWLITTSYTIQLYYDFSGYCDMAIGLALLFNIKLPVNFNSPYKAINIQDFWRRWHITLSTWLKDYIYIPLGGNRKGNISAAVNVFITFLIGGVWHGAGWNFILWGGLHGFALAIHRVWSLYGKKLPIFISWLLTIMFVHFSWVFFRAEDVTSAISIISTMLNVDFSLSGINLLITHAISVPFLSAGVACTLMAFLLFCTVFSTFVMRNSLEIARYNNDGYVFSNKIIAFYGAIFGLSSLSMLITSTSPFLYFNF